MSHHLMDEAAFEDAEARWQQTLSLSQSLSTAIESLETAMIAATFGTFEDANVQRVFETRALPCAITTVIGRSDLENDLPALGFLQHAVEFFIRTIDRDNESLMEALRPVIVFRPAAVNNPRIRAPTNGPYDFYANNILTTGRSSTFDGIQIPLSLYRGYHRERRKVASRASPPRTHRVLDPTEGEHETAVSRDSRVPTSRAPESSNCETSDAGPQEDGSEGDMIGPVERARPLTERWGQAPPEASNSAVQLMDVDNETSVAATETVTVGDPVVGVRKRSSGGREANENEKGGENQETCRQEKERCGSRGASVEAGDERAAERDQVRHGNAGDGNAAEDTGSRDKCAEDGEAKEGEGGAPAERVRSPLSEELLEDWGKAAAACDRSPARLVHEVLEVACQSGPAGEHARKAMNFALKQAELMVRGRATEESAKATLNDTNEALLLTACRLVEDEEDSDVEDDIEGDSMSGDDSEDDEHSGGEWEPESIILHEEKAKAVFDDGFEETCSHYLSILNWFACKRGVTALGKRLDSRPPPKATIVRGLVEMLCSVAEVLPNDDAEDILRTTRSRLETYLKEVSPEDLKRSPETRAALFGAMDHVSVLMSTLGHMPKEDKLAVLSTRYSLCLQYLKGTTLQVRLAGLLELGKTIVHVQVALTREHHQRQHFLVLQQKETQERKQNVEIMTAAERMELMHLRSLGVAEQDSSKCLGDNLSTWILKDGLMECLFSAEFLHTETLKRSGDIPRFLAWLGRLSNDHVELIWNAARQSAHESIRHAVLQLLQGLFPVLSKQQLCLVNNFARRLSKSEFDGRTLLLLKHLAASAAKFEMERLTDLGLEAVVEQELLAPMTTAAAAAASGGSVIGGECEKGGGESRSRRGALSGLEVLWECVQDDEAAAERGTLSPALHEEAFLFLVHIVGQLTGGLPCSMDPRVWLLDEVVICLKERKSVVQALRVLRALLDSFHQFVITVIRRQESDRLEGNGDREGVLPVVELPGTQQGLEGANASEKTRNSQSDGEAVQSNGVGGDVKRASARDSDDRKREVCRRERGSREEISRKKETEAVPAATVPTSQALQQTRRRRRQPQVSAITAVQVATNMGITDLALAELMQYKEYACRRVRELGLESGEAVDDAVLEGKVYRHLDAMRYRLRLLQTLVSLTSHVITQAQAEGLWLGLVERALSDAELDLSFEALLTLGRDTPQGLPTLSRTFFERICCQHESSTEQGDGVRRSPHEIRASPCAGDFVAVGKASEQRRLFHLRKLRPPGFRFFISSLEATNLALGRLRHRGAVAHGTASAGRTVCGTMGDICGGGDGDDHPGAMQGPLAFELSEGVDCAGVRGRKFGVPASVSLPKYVVVSMNLMGLEALWSIALEVEAEEVSEAAIKKLCELCLHVEVSEDVPAEAVAKERAAFVSRCTERLARAAAVLGPGRGCGTGDRASEAERNAAIVSATRSLQLLLAYLDEAGGRMRAQGLSVHSHCGNQVVSSMVTIRVQIYQGGTRELGILSHQTVHSLRLAVANRQGPEWTAAGTRLIFRGRELRDDSTLEEEGLLEGGVVQAVKRIKPTTGEQISTPMCIRPSPRAKESQEAGPVEALCISPTPETAISSNKSGGHSTEQRGRKRAASFVAGDPCGEDLAPPSKVRANSGASDVSGGGSAATVPTSMDIDEGPSDSSEKDESEAKANGNRGREGSSLPTALSVFSGSIVKERMGAGSPPSENRRAGAVGHGPSEIGVAPKVKAKVAPPELPLLELEKQSTVDTLFELMESGQSVSVLVWDLLMKMPTNMSLYNGFSSIGLSSDPKSAAESPLSFLRHASPSRLLYSLMIVENLFDRDLMREEGMSGPGADMATQLALAGAMEQRNHVYDLNSAESVIGPGRDTVAAVARRPHRGFEGGDDWEDFSLGGEHIHIHGGSRTWRERFVRSGGINTLVELLLARDWDAARSVAGGGEGTVGISLAWLALLLVLLERFMDGGFLPQPKQLRQLLERLPVVLLTTSRCFRELTCPPIRDAGHHYQNWRTGVTADVGSAACSPYNRGRQAGQQGNAAGVGGGVSCKGEFDPLVEAVKAARSCATIINHLLSFGLCLTPGAPSETFELLTLRGRAGMAIAMASSTAFGEAVREALVRSPSRDLRGNTMALLASLAAIDGALVEEGEKARIAGEDRCSISLTTTITRLLLSLVPYCRTEPDGSKCDELYELLSDFMSKGGLDLRAVCDALPGLPPPSPRLVPGQISPSVNNSDDFGAFYCDVDGPLLGPASLWEQKFVAPAVASLSVFVSKDGDPSLVQAVPILVWLMRLIVEPRVTPADGHLSGLLGLARVVVRWLGPRGKEAVGLWGLEGIVVPRRQRQDGDEEGKTNAGGLLHHVYHDNLFNIATHENHGPLAPPKCRSEICRANAFGLLTDLATGCRPNVAVLVKLLLRHHSTTSPCQTPNLPSSPGSSCTDASVDAFNADASVVGGCGVEGGVERTSWSYAPRQTDKADCGYVGLQNLGATCYMNSLLQQLFMVPALRFGVLSCDPFFRTEEEKRKGVEAVPPEENLLYQLQVMFGYLQESEKKFLDPRGMCRACKDAGGQPVDPLEQQDVDEFLLVFLDRLETQLKNLPQKRLLQHVFGGHLCNQLIGQESECPHVSERREDFFVLGLDVKGKRSITESLQLYVEGEVLAGDNKFLCAQCDQKRDTLKRTCIARLPNVLFLHLKRFEFDMEQMRKVKVNDSCEFPMELNMRPYTKEGLLDQQRGQRGGTEASGGEGQGFGGATAAYPDAYYEYKLAGVLVHTGTADSGHYYSYIKRRDVQGGGGSGGDAESESWFSFNDALVTPFDPASLPITCYGGYTMNANGRGMTVRQWSAYMLIYEREYVLPNPTPATTPTLAPTPDIVTPSQNGNSLANGSLPEEAERATLPAGDSDVGSVLGDGDKWEPPWSGVPRPSELVPPSVFQACWLENRLFLMDKNVFSAEYLNWVCDLTTLVPPPKAPYLSVNPSTAGDRDGQRKEKGQKSDDVEVDVDVDEVESSVAKVALYLALDTVARAKDKERLSQLILYVRNWFRGSPSVCRWALEQMTTNNYWQHTMLLQCSLHGVRNEFLQLCVELCRCYAPFERQIYYQEDPDIGHHQYLSAVPNRKQQQGGAEGCGENARQRRQQEGRAVDQGSRDDETVSNPALEALNSMTEAERCVFLKEHGRGVVCKYPSSVDSGEGTDGGSDMSETGSLATDEADFGDRIEEDWPHSPTSPSFVRHHPSGQASGTAASCSSLNAMEEDERTACAAAAARARMTPIDAAQSPSSSIFPTPQPPSISPSTPPRTPPRRPPSTPPSGGIVGADATSFNGETRAGSRGAARRPGVGLLMWTRLGKLAAAATGVEGQDTTRENSTTPKRCFREAHHKSDREVFAAVSSEQQEARTGHCVERERRVKGEVEENRDGPRCGGSAEGGDKETGVEVDKKGVSAAKSPGSSKKRSLLEMELATGVDGGNAGGREGGGEVCRGNGALATDGIFKGEGQSGKRRLTDRVTKKPKSNSDIKVLCEEVPRRARWWNSRALVCRFIGTILDLVHELLGSNGRSSGRSRGLGSGVGARRGTPLAQMRKQSEHLFGLLLEIARINPAETRLLVRMGAIPRVLHSILGEAWPLVSGEFLERHGYEDTDHDVHHSGSFGEIPTVDAWVSGTNAFAPCLKLITELACSCPVAGDNPPVFESEMEISGDEAARTGDKAGDGGRRTLASVNVQEYESCFTSSMDPSARDKRDEEMIILPHEGEVRMLTDPAVLELLLVGRPKMNTIPQPRLQHEQVLFVVRLTRHICWNSPSATKMVMTECARGLQEKQVQMFHMHLRVLMGLFGVTDQHHHRRVVQVLDHLLRAAEINLEFTKECLEIWRVLAKGLLGMMPEIFLSDVVPTLRITLLQQSERIIAIFLLNPKLTSDIRQTAAFCLQLTVPEMWVSNGYHTPRCLPLNSLKLPPSIAHDAGAAAASPVGRSSSFFGAGSTPSPALASAPTSAAASMATAGGEGNAANPNPTVAVAAAALAQVAGWNPRGDRRDSGRAREEDAAEARSLAVAFADNDDAMAVDGGSTSAESSDDVQILGVVPGVPKNNDVSPTVSRGNGGCGSGEDVRGTSRWSEPSPASRETGGSTPRPVGPQQQQHQQHGGHERGSNGSIKEPKRKEGLSQQSMDQANWLMQQLMKEIPRAMDIIEALKAAAEGANHRTQQVNFFEMVQLMTHLITGSKTEGESLARTLPDFLESFFKLDRMRRTDDLTKGIMVKFIYDVMEKHPELCCNLKEESVANSLLVYFVSWQDKHSNADYNATYASIFYKLLLKACTLYPSVLDLVRQSANLHWCMEWFILRGHCPTMEMAITLMSLLKLCLRRYGWPFAMEAVAWIIGPPASDIYLKVDEQDPNARVPLYALWMLEVCLRDQLGNEEMGAVQHLIRSEWALDQVTRILIHVRDAERTVPRQMLTSRSHIASQDRHRKALVLCESLLAYVYDWVQFGTVNVLRRAEGGNCSSMSSRQDDANSPHGSSRSSKSVDQGDLQRREKAQQNDAPAQGCDDVGHADQVKQDDEAKVLVGRLRRCSKGVNGMGGVSGEEAEIKGRRGQGQRGDVEEQRDGNQQQQQRKRRQQQQQSRLKPVQQQSSCTERLEQLQPQSAYTERLELLQRKWHHARDAAVWLFHRLLQWEQSSTSGGSGKVAIEDTERHDHCTSDWMPRQDTRVRLRKLLNFLVSNISLCARDVGEAIVTETTRRVQRMTQVHIHRRNGEGSGAGGSGYGISGSSNNSGSGSNSGAKDSRNGAYEAQMLLMKELSSKIMPHLKHSVTESQNDARVHMLEAEEATAQLSAEKGVAVKEDAEAKGSGDGSKATGGVTSAAQGEDVDREAKKEKEEAKARETLEEQRRIHTSEAEKSQQSAEIYASVVTNLLYATATAASSCDMKSANNVAKSLQDQISRGDPYALRLVSGAYAESFLGHLVEHCAPVSGCVRQYGGEDLGGDVESSDILGLAAVMVPEALKHMDDQALNIHLSTLCNSLADAASDVIRNLRDRAFSLEDGRGTSVGGRGDNRAGRVCRAAAGGGSGNSVQETAVAKSENREHPAHAGVRALKEVCLWLNLFFKASEGTKEACHAGCLGALTDLSQAASDHADAFIASELRDSIKIFDLTQQSAAADGGNASES